MEFCGTYIETDKFNEMVEFYEKVFQKKGNVYTENRWVEFDFGNKLSIYNRLFDEDRINAGNSKKHFDENYVKDFLTETENRQNNIVVFNFYTPNLKDEYERIKSLKICRLSEIMYVNITAPYYFFNIYDPEGNTIEICSESLS